MCVSEQAHVQTHTAKGMWCVLTRLTDGWLQRMTVWLKYSHTGYIIGWSD